MKEVRIAEDLYEAIEKVLDEYGFKTVDEYVDFVLRQAITPDDDNEHVFSKEEEEIIKQRLKDLGYLD